MHPGRKEYHIFSNNRIENWILSGPNFVTPDEDLLFEVKSGPSQTDDERILRKIFYENNYILKFSENPIHFYIFSTLANWSRKEYSTEVNNTIIF